ncbi:Holliday junction resolvase RuvX [bacterium]|nr:Holliday junction resolvase RuvX [bacterium]
MRSLGLDIGDKTVGVAVSDGLGITAQALETIYIKSPQDSFKRLLEIISEYDVKILVPGLPLNMNGTEGPRVAKTKEFIRQLEVFLNKRNTFVEIIYWDERLSSAAVERTLLEADMSREKRKKVIDKLAASYILQGYLDSKRIYNDDTN